ncbi:prolipoprotein diacylglyceryl transferase [Blattabacterium cuenoti]|uniref:prolipoprotein diacylglyceryl transferase n=1 Tax=Blattabacterium cuenoti TaxID=1653831 RepID=UPI00374C908C
MFLISFLLGWGFIYYIYQKENIKKEHVDSLFRYIFFGTILGARIGEIIFYSFPYFSSHWIEAIFPVKEDYNHSILGIIKGYQIVGYRGLSSHGASIGIIFSILLYYRNNGKKLRKSIVWLFDHICIISSISAVFIRIGNFFNSEIVGKPCSGTYPFSIKFVQMDTKIYGKITPRHPTQIYEAIIYLFIFLLLCYIYRIQKMKEGYLSGLFFIFIWISRFVIEFVKEPQSNEYIHLYFLNTGQLLSIPFIIFGFFLINRSIIMKKYFSS